MNICIFPGTFNPIHSAHLKMAEFVQQKYKFDKIIFIPAYIPPHKDVDKSLAEHRYNMVKLAISGNKYFVISDIEYKSGGKLYGKSYSIITVQKIRNEYGVNGRLPFLIGADAFKNIKTWYESDKLKELTHFIVYPRGNDVLNDSEFNDYSWELLNAPKLDLSSTNLRLGGQVHTVEKVKEYIDKNKLYS